ncbi:hypothetical protein Mal15_34080 [Stieleria maiorica]|uniref:Uncharacterized protein n=1 Tax=Stieleria maiorica TaxID=2795974 RepID=A0A5B9MI73_9BACT|nr:hypothetical protein Mal15_34080 [Stieleria maiorica]
MEAQRLWRPSVYGGPAFMEAQRLWRPVGWRQTADPKRVSRNRKRQNHTNEITNESNDFAQPAQRLGTSETRFPQTTKPLAALHR